MLFKSDILELTTDADFGHNYNFYKDSGCANLML